MRDKLIRLQKLYIDQFQRLQYLLKEERRDFKQGVRKEKEDQLMSIQRQPKDTPEEIAAYEKIKALNHYNKPQGKICVFVILPFLKSTKICPLWPFWFVNEKESKNSCLGAIQA